MRPGRAGRLPAFLLLLLSLHSSGRPAARPPDGPYAPAGFRENSPDPRPALLSLLGDMRVHVDLEEHDMPRSRIGGTLSAAEVREAVALGLGNWASVLPDFRFRLVDSRAEANLAMRFRDYGTYIPGGSTALAFLPGQWKSRGFDLACGAEAPGKLPGGGACAEGENNIFLFQTRETAFRRVHFLDPVMHHAYLAAKTDRKDPRKRWFRALPDGRYGAWPPDRSTCVSGGPRGGVLPAWDVQCPEEADWESLPHFDRFGAVEGPYDLATLVQHEFGHALLGDHTGEGGGCLEVTGRDYRDFSRDPVHLSSGAVRLAAWKDAAGRRAASYSVLFPGNGLDAAWNHRGVFEADAARLAAGSLDGRCGPAGEWRGYRVTYPRSRAWIVLGKASGERKYVDDWRYAQRLMEWPVSGGRPAAGWFQVGLQPKAPAPGSGAP